MVRIRWHGRGGQGIKTGSRILGGALFRAGFEVQDAPVYGAERRGAPIAAYVRADRAPIRERGVIARPDLVVLADATLLGVPAAAVLQGIDAGTTVLIQGHREPAAGDLAPVRCLMLPPQTDDNPDARSTGGARCAGAAARLLGSLSRGPFEAALREELAGMDDALIERNLAAALDAYEAMAPHAGTVRDGAPAPAAGYSEPEWIDLPLETARLAVPSIFAPETSLAANTGLWRTLRPEIDYAHCNRCSWVCATLCPDSAIRVRDDRTPEIDLAHCKGCMVCVAVCPPHAIRALPEREARPQWREGVAA